MVIFALLVLISSPETSRLMQAQGGGPVPQVLQRCAEYSGAGDLLEAQISAAAFNLAITRPGGQRTELNGSIPAGVPVSQLQSLTTPCQLAVSASSDRAALGIPTANGVTLELVDLTSGVVTKTIPVPKASPIQFSIHRMGYIGDSDVLAVAQAHYRLTGEPEVSTYFVSSDGSMALSSYKALGAPYTEVFASSFDFCNGRVWFSCPVYSARLDRQPRCTLTSALLGKSSALTLDIGPPPDDRVIGSGQPSLGFPSSREIVLLADRRFWLYNVSTRSFRQLNLPESPQHIRWFEFPGQPKFSSDGSLAAVPIYLYHAPLFQEGQVSHGTKLLIIDMTRLEILKIIQPPKKQNIVDFALHNEGKSLTLTASWGADWQRFSIPIDPYLAAK